MKENMLRPIYLEIEKYEKSDLIKIRVEEVKKQLGVEVSKEVQSNVAEPSNFKEIVMACLMNKDVSLEKISALVDV